MDKKIERILNDLYMLDGSLKKHDKEVRKIVEELLYSKPDAQVNEKFVEELHYKLERRMESLKEEKERRKSVSGIFNFSTFVYSLAGVAAVVVAVVGLVTYINQGKNQPIQVAVDTTQKIDKLQDNAFGQLAFDRSRLASGATGLGGGGGGVGPQIATKPGMPAPEVVNYRYVYKGGDIGIQSTTTVYKRIKELPLVSTIIGSLGSLDLGLINLNKLSNLQPGNLNLTENREFGYDISLDFREGMVSMFSNGQWPDINAGCQDAACYDSRRLKESDVLKDEELIAIANKFLDDYQIDRSSYADPIVVKDYANFPQPFEANAVVYVPETIPVVYPQKINGENVYDDAGNVTGLTVDVNIRYKKVYGSRNIMSQKYESSGYAAEQDKAKILSFAENGGIYGGYTIMGASKTVDIELGTPKIELIMIWNYDSVKRASDNLYVPAYVFPITKIPEGQYFYRKNVIVPVPKEILEKFNQPSGAMIPAPFINK